MTHWSDLLCNRSQKSSPADSFVKCSSSGCTQAYVVPKDVGAAGSWLCWQAGEVSMKLQRSSHLFLAGAFGAIL